MLLNTLNERRNMFGKKINLFFCVRLLPTPKKIFLVLMVTRPGTIREECCLTLENL